MKTITTKLTAMPTAQARITISDTHITLISYETPTVIIDRAASTLTVTGLYSATTRKHISAFMREYLRGIADYYTAKEIAGRPLKFDIIERKIINA